LRDLAPPKPQRTAAASREARLLRRHNLRLSPIVPRYDQRTV